MFISQAWAGPAGSDVTAAADATGQMAATGGGLEQFIPFILIAVVFYFLLIRPQQKKMKEDEAMRKELKRGDKVLTAGGIIAKVVKVADTEEVTLEIAEGVQIKVYKTAINSILSEKPAAAKEKDAA